MAAAQRACRQPESVCPADRSSTSSYGRLARPAGDHAALFEDEQARDRLEAVLKKYGTAASAAEAVRRVLAATLGSEEESEVDEGRAADEFSEFYWHRDMLCDTRRNTAFDAAIRHAIKMRQDAS